MIFCFSGTPKKCAPGTFMNTTGYDYCFNCPAGYFCDYKVGENIIVPQPCPEGHYCPGNTTSAIPKCPTGTINPNFYMSDMESHCLPCPGGHYCDKPGAIEYDGSLNDTGVAFCAPGYYCKSGVNVSTPTPETTSGVGGPCPAGFYCPEKTEDPVPCPNATYRDAIGGWTSENCTACKRGYYCSGLNLTDATGPCDEGFYCLEGNALPNPSGK